MLGSQKPLITTPTPKPLHRQLGAAWGLWGIVILLAYSAFRLAKYSWSITEYQLSFIHIITLLLWTAFMIYFEVIRGFAQSFSPKLMIKIDHIAQQGSWIQILLAPLFCLSYFGAPLRKRMATYILTASIIIAILLIRQLSQPWRAIMDIGAAIGLSLSITTIFYQLWKTRWSNSSLNSKIFSSIPAKKPATSFKQK